MVYGEATITFPLIVGYAFHAKNWQARSEKNFNKVLEKITPQVKN
jgi:deoxyhypusine synthase